MKYLNFIKKKFLLSLTIIISLTACNETLSPKPKGYPREYFPQKEYREFTAQQCGYSFEIPVYAEMDKNPSYTDGHPCWYNLDFKPFDATLHISFHEYNSEAEFDSLYEDTHKLVYKHISRADDIEEAEINSENNSLSGVLFELKGNTATNLNFYLIDNSHRYFRGALYFNSATTPDSIAPVFNFIHKDVLHLISTFKWE